MTVSSFSPGVTQLAAPYGYVDLEAQVSGTTVSTYNWNTSGISSDASSIAGASTYNLTFQWNRSFTTSHTDSITLSVTDVNSHTETFTYDFYLPESYAAGSGSGGNATWPASLAPDQELDRRSGLLQHERLGRRYQRRRSTPRLTCPATTPTSRLSRFSMTRSPQIRCRSSSSKTP